MFAINIGYSNDLGNISQNGIMMPLEEFGNCFSKFYHRQGHGPLKVARVIHSVPGVTTYSRICIHLNYKSLNQVTGL